MLNQLKTKAAEFWAGHSCHRAFYAGLGFAHANGCWMTDYPALYAPMALLYAGLAIRG